ncbi:stalk domain-containing protein [Paenibacillus daejeonensis]|uniref:stalk domain-containing protein n=1 Tax=Paenibacillus daejeonensis TaxID=135193 RepID=UPI0003741800|nr:stalk domain-containing protein [Paenibacillus daejeonensis]
MNNRKKAHQWLTVTKMLAVLVLALIAVGPAAMAQQNVKVYVGGQSLQFGGQQPVIIKGTTLVPFRAMFEALGFDVVWHAGSKTAVGTKDGLKIELTVNKGTALVNGKSQSLSVPAQVMKGSTMIPLRFVSEHSGYEVNYAKEAGATVIRIGGGSGGPAPGGAGAPSPGTGGHTVVEPGIVKGRVVDAEGQPLQGALVTADNQLLYNSNAQAVTDANGYYRIPLGMEASTYMAYAEYATTLNGQKYVMDLVSVNDAPFAGTEGAIRDFKQVLDSSGPSGGSGYVLFYMMDLIHPLDPIAVPPDRDDVTLTLKPVSPGLNGKVGQTIVSKGSNSNNGYGVHHVPIGTYEISATYAPPGEEPQQMLIRLVERGQDKPFYKSVTTDFETVVSKIYRIQLELKLDVVPPPPPSYDPDDWEW